MYIHKIGYARKDDHINFAGATYFISVFLEEG